MKKEKLNYLEKCAELWRDYGRLCDRCRVDEHRYDELRARCFTIIGDYNELIEELREIDEHSTNIMAEEWASKLLTDARAIVKAILNTKKRIGEKQKKQELLCEETEDAYEELLNMYIQACAKVTEKGRRYEVLLEEYPRMFESCLEVVLFEKGSFEEQFVDWYEAVGDECQLWAEEYCGIDRKRAAIERWYEDRVELCIYAKYMYEKICSVRDKIYWKYPDVPGLLNDLRWERERKKEEKWDMFMQEITDDVIENMALAS